MQEPAHYHRAPRKSGRSSEPVRIPDSIASQTHSESPAPCDGLRIIGNPSKWLLRSTKMSADKPTISTFPKAFQQVHNVSCYKSNSPTELYVLIVGGEMNVELRIQNLSKTYNNGVKALDNISEPIEEHFKWLLRKSKFL